MPRRTLCPLILALSIPFVASAQPRRPLDHDAYELWKSIEHEALSNDGRWMLYSLAVQDGDSELMIHDLASGATHAIPRAKSPQFTEDSRFVVALVAPAQALVKEAKQQKKKSEDLPKDGLAILDLRSGELFRAERVRSFKLPTRAGGWLAYLHEAEQAPTEKPPEPAEPPAPAGKAKEEKKPGTVLVVRNLATGAETRHDFVTEFALAPDGQRLAYATSSQDGSADGVFVVELGDGSRTGILTGEGVYKGLAFDDRGVQGAFLSNRDDYDADQPGFALYHWRAGDGAAQKLAVEGAEGLPPGWWVSEHGDVSFSHAGGRLFFGSAPRPAPEVDDPTLEEDRVDVEIWNWRDPFLQPMQSLQRDRERRRSYRAVVHLADGKVVQLANGTVPDVEDVRQGDGEFVLGTSGLPYRQLISWDSPDYQDVYTIDVQTGGRHRILEKLQGEALVSPGGRFVFWWDNVELAWFARDVRAATVANMTRDVPHPLHNEDHDWPYRPNPYGHAGWTEGDAAFLVYDRYDIWAVDPSGRAAPRNLTDGVGRREGLRFRYVRLDEDARAVPADEPLLLSAFHLRTKAAGFYRDRVSGTDRPMQLLFEERRFSRPSKAKDADVLIYSRESVEEFPDLWAADGDFGNRRKVSHANPQQGDYRWATVEMLEWHSTDGVPLQGLLYKPEDFDPSRRYPMMVTFYEKDSDNLYAHHPPVPHRSVIRPTFYASRGYLVFVPDIVYQVGYPGESAMDCVVPGVLALVRRGFVDEGAIGVQGHSWGGYQIAYMVTKTDLFAAAAGGAPVSNMISAYGGIRWGTGRSRMFQYEKTQSRIGATLWEAPMRYIENSPIFWADKIETPLLMMHNDHDSAVPWYQGIEMFVALRRLGKPAWLVNYVNEVHWPQAFHERRDWNIRMQQFFDHYLQGAPAPVWLEEGIPALRKGKTLGLELVEEARSAPGRR